MTTKTITDYHVAWRMNRDGVESVTAFPTRAAAERWRAMWRDGTVITLLDDKITEERHAYHVGQPVSVLARGAWRTGHVVRIMRTRVEVDYARNRKGERGVRAFYPSEIHTYDGE
jgi:hypothetical protein